jgi:ABC-type multidrug transport system fused ATPase/permease subunit
MLLGFIAPTSGHITVGGIDLREVDRRTWLEQLSYLPQDPFFMAGSVRSNLRLADPQATDEVLWRALESSGLADFVASLPAGIDSGVGEAGKLLSAGQRRRLAVARTLLRRSPTSRLPMWTLRPERCLLER